MFNTTTAKKTQINNNTPQLRILKWFLSKVKKITINSITITTLNVENIFKSKLLEHITIENASGFVLGIDAQSNLVVLDEYAISIKLNIYSEKVFPFYFDTNRITRSDKELPETLCTQLISTLLFTEPKIFIQVITEIFADLQTTALKTHAQLLTQQDKSKDDGEQLAKLLANIISLLLSLTVNADQLAVYRYICGEIAELLYNHGDAIFFETISSSSQPTKNYKVKNLYALLFFILSNNDKHKLRSACYHDIFGIVSDSIPEQFDLTNYLKTNPGAFDTLVEALGSPIADGNSIAELLSMCGQNGNVDTPLYLTELSLLKKVVVAKTNNRDEIAEEKKYLLSALKCNPEKAVPLLLQYFSQDLDVLAFLADHYLTCDETKARGFFGKINDLLNTIDPKSMVISNTFEILFSYLRAKLVTDVSIIDAGISTLYDNVKNPLAVEKLEKLADTHPQAALLIGKYFYETSDNYHKTQDYLTLASGKHIGEASFYLYLLRSKLGTLPHFAFHHLKPAVLDGYEPALEKFEELAKSDTPNYEEVQLELGLTYLELARQTLTNNNDPNSSKVTTYRENAARYLRICAKRNSAEAMIALAQALIQGIIQEIEPNEATTLLNAAIHTGNKEAFQELEKLADASPCRYPTAQILLGKFYLKGAIIKSLTIERNNSEAKKYLFSYYYANNKSDPNNPEKLSYAFFLLAISKELDSVLIEEFLLAYSDTFIAEDICALFTACIEQNRLVTALTILSCHKLQRHLDYNTLFKLLATKHIDSDALGPTFIAHLLANQAIAKNVLEQLGANKSLLLKLIIDKQACQVLQTNNPLEGNWQAIFIGILQSNSLNNNKQHTILQNLPFFAKNSLPELVEQKSYIDFKSEIYNLIMETRKWLVAMQPKNNDNNDSYQTAIDFLDKTLLEFNKITSKSDVDSLLEKLVKGSPWMVAINQSPANIPQPA